MAHHARDFWKELEQRLPEDGRDRHEEIARTVLRLLRQRIRPEEAQHLEAEMPEDLKGLWATRGTGVAEERTARRIVELDHNQFVGRVRADAKLPDMKRAAQATAAVFGAMRRVVPDRESEHVEDELPSGLKQLWRGDHEQKGPHEEQGSSPYWALLTDRLEGRVPASATRITRAVLTHLRARLPSDLAERIHRELPPDLRDYWARATPDSARERREQPERFFGRVAEELDLGANTGAARHATAAVMGALRRALPPELAEDVERNLPAELRGFWEGM